MAENLFYFHNKQITMKQGVGRSNASASVIPGISIGIPPACQTPRFISSARCLNKFPQLSASLKIPLLHNPFAAYVSDAHMISGLKLQTIDGCEGLLRLYGSCGHPVSCLLDDDRVSIAYR